MSELLLKIAKRHAVRMEDMRIKRCPLVFDHKEAGNDRSITAIANTAAVDLDDEVVVPEGADTSYFFNNRTIFWNHDYSLPVAKLRHAVPKAGKWIVNMVFSASAFAQDVQKMVVEGLVSGTSIGFIPLDRSRPSAEELKTYGAHSTIVRRWKWLELSVTPLPCNMEAIIAAGEAGKVAPGTVRKMALPRKKRVMLMVA